MITKCTRRLVAQKRGVLLDLSFGGTPQPGALTLSPTGDIPHDPTVIPFPLPTGCVHTAMITHVLEFLEPASWFAWWDELHRIMKPHGVVFLSGPYGGDESQGWLSDPTHKTRVVEQSIAWLDPGTPFYALHPSLGRKTPKPWQAMAVHRVPGTHGTVSYNFTLRSHPTR